MRSDSPLRWPKCALNGLALAAHQQLRFSTAAIVGLGGVGLRVARGLAATGTRLLAADIDERRRRDAEQLGAAWLPAAEALRAEVDLLVPAATGRMITRDLVAQMRCRCMLGPANNQLDDPETRRSATHSPRSSPRHGRGACHRPERLASAHSPS